MEFSTNIYEEKMEKSLSNLQEDYVSIRAGRANHTFLTKFRLIIMEHLPRFNQ